MGGPRWPEGRQRGRRSAESGSSGSYPDERHSRRYLADESAVRHADPAPEPLSQSRATGPIGDGTRLCRPGRRHGSSARDRRLLVSTWSRDLLWARRSRLEATAVRSGPVLGAVDPFPCPPVGEVAGLGRLPDVVAGRVAVPDVAQACSGRDRCCWVGAHLALLIGGNGTCAAGGARCRPARPPEAGLGNTSRCVPTSAQADQFCGAAYPSRSPRPPHSPGRPDGPGVTDSMSPQPPASRDDLVASAAVPDRGARRTGDHDRRHHDLPL
ncbi:hypothetical protein FB558_5767 [Pseudonocardia kunmingensis]|uniref:Uncharacterized protein n=1 Tax=Pseudonocardia kunmingensis TaxID=630975 RepID=A0A543DKZ1_9PSEU|nr:hypothetical protein FB558_5767 [Pseudonocardia kunmingensis]